MELEIDLKKIAEVTRSKQEENIAFRRYIESQSVTHLDLLVKRLNNTITPKIDCLSCGNCCLNLRPVADDKVLLQFVKEEDLDTAKYAWGFACKHLCDKKCSIYTKRPQECRLYPYMDSANFMDRMHGVLQNVEICPIVFNILEQLKVELGWRYLS